MRKTIETTKDLIDLLTVIDENKAKRKREKGGRRQIFVIISEYTELLPETDIPTRASQLLLECGETILRAVAIRYWKGDMSIAYKAIYGRERTFLIEE